METIKEEKKADLEQLLNSLIEKGWKPRGRDTRDIDEIRIERLDRMGCYQNMDYISFMRFDDRQQDWFTKYGCSIVDLVSKGSGLWQFVCENGMVKKPDIDRGEVHNWDNPNHWLCECALKDESELEDFLLQNIKVEGQ